MHLFLLFNTALAAPIDQVVVYTDRAEVTRTGTATCQKGIAQLRFSDLPPILDPKTIRGFSKDKVEIIGVSSKKIIIEQPLNEDIVALQKRIDELDTKLSQTRDIQLEFSDRETTVRAYGTYFESYLSEDVRSEKPNTGKWAEGLDTLQKERTELLRQKQETSQAQRKLLRERELLQNQIDNLQFVDQNEAYEAVVSVKCGSAKRTSVSLSYVIEQVSWYPEYDLRYIEKSGEVELSTSAVIRQSTGENWNDVRLILSTASPALGGESPYPAAIYVSASERTEAKVMVSATEDRSLLQAGGGKDSTSSKTIQDQGNSFVLEIPKKVSIKSNGHEYWFPVDRLRTPAQSKNLLLPRLSPKVYQTIHFDNPAPYPLLSGQLHIHKNKTYMGTQSLSYRAPKDKMELSMGVDSEVLIERNPITEKDKNKGLISTKTLMSRAYRIRVHNTSKEAKSIEIRENIPVSKDSDIKVTLNKTYTTAGYTLDERQGFVIWNITVPPSGKQNLDLYFQVQIPESWGK